MTRIAAVALSALALAFAGCGDDDEDTTSAAPAETPAAQTTDGQTGAAPAPEAAAGEVIMKGIRFQPADITVKVGDTVTWKNEDPVEHNAVDEKTGQFKSELFGEGGTYEFEAKEAGKIDYVCTVHPGMTGTITVE
jgi:plastocyanin